MTYLHLVFILVNEMHKDCQAFILEKNGGTGTNNLQVKIVYEYISITQ